MNETFRMYLRYLAALAVLAGAVLHLKIWNSDYRTIPIHAVPGLWVVKYGFPGQAAVSVVLVLVILFVRKPVVWVVGILVEIGSLLALVLSREASIFGWKEVGYSTNAKEVIVAEVIAVLALAVLTTMQFVHNDTEDELATL